MSDLQAELLATARDVFGRADATSDELEKAIQASGLTDVAEVGDMADVAAVIRLAAYHRPESDYPDRVMPPLDDRSGALNRSLRMAGALARARDLALAYAAEREQFGRPLNRFQAVQGMLAELISLAALAVAATDAAAIEGTEEAAAAAKVAVDDAASRGASLAHQVVGAIGFTDEHALHHATLAIWRWRDEFGTAATWSDYLGAQAIAAGDGLWELVSRS